ncbi:MAG: RNA pseudouridine synthase, partial [Granulosicoccus sp.]|nr:RNA pseudouridine synthase [Granulosicoccus sp.]
VRTDESLGYLTAYSGMLQGVWELPGFVPPLFDIQIAKRELDRAATEIASLDARIADSHVKPALTRIKSALSVARQQADAELRDSRAMMRQRKTERRRQRASNDTSVNLAVLDRQSQHERGEHQRLKAHWANVITDLDQSLEELSQQQKNLERTRKRISQAAQKRHFDNYVLYNSTGQQQFLSALFAPEVPPGGAGDCAAPKLLQYAYRQGWTPVALAEFWLGPSTKAGIRHHREFYPPCRSRCAPILDYMLPQAASVSSAIVSKPIPIPMPEVDEVLTLTPQIVYEDQDLLVLNKPAGLLSIPGKTIRWSVLAWLRLHYPDATGALLVHRLDMDTSGLLLAAKSASVHKALQLQFLKRSVQKRYTAILDGSVSANKGTVSLPLRVDLGDRPRQLVCRQFGKSAETHYSVLERANSRVRVRFHPVTGRTHQLRVHAAHQLGLAAPISGDLLYGFAADRLYLHADSLDFFHPRQQRRVSFTAPVPF